MPLLQYRAIVFSILFIIVIGMEVIGVVVLNPLMEVTLKPCCPDAAFAIIVVQWY